MLLNVKSTLIIDYLDIYFNDLFCYYIPKSLYLCRCICGRIILKLPGRFSSDLLEGRNTGQGRIHYICGQVCSTSGTKQTYFTWTSVGLLSPSAFIVEHPVSARRVLVR